MSQSEEIEHFKRLNEKLRTEREAAVQRAARRHRDMMHANRRAERAEQAHKKEAWERIGDQVKTATLLCTYKATINALELASMQAQQSGPSNEQFQTMQATNARLEAEILEQRRTGVQLQRSTEETIPGIHAKAQANESQMRSEAAQHYEERLMETKKQLSEEFSRKAQAGMVQIQKVYLACKAENENLKQRLQQATEAIEWQRRNTQQQTAEHVNMQSQLRDAGIYAGFPLPSHQSPVPVKETANKRRKLDSTGNPGIITPDRQRGRRNSTNLNVSASTLKRKAREELTPPTDHSITPRQQQRPSLYAGTPQQSHQSQRQPQSLPSHLQGIPQAQQLFWGFIRQLNAQRLKSGQTELGPQEAVHLFSQWAGQKLRQQVPTLLSDNTVLEHVLQDSDVSHRAFSQEDDPNTGLQFPFLSADTSFDPQTLSPLNKISPSSGRSVTAKPINLVHQKLTQQQQQQQQEYPQSMSLSPEFKSQSLANALPALPTGYDNTSPAAFSNNTILTRLTQPQATTGVEDVHHGSQLAFQPRNADIYLSPEEPERAQDLNRVSFLTQPLGWGSPALKPGSGSFDMSNAQLSFTDSNSHSPGADFTFEGFPITTEAAMPSLPFMQIDQSNQNDRVNPKHHGVQLQRHSQFYPIYPALLSNSQAHDPTDKFINKSSSNYNRSKPLQHSMNETPAPYNQTPSQAPAPYQPTSRQRSAPPPSNRSAPAPSTRSTPAPSGPLLAVCLHCHENWWNDSCDGGEPCQNCIGSGKACQRPQCLNFAMGTCDSTRCPRVHEGDMRYKNVAKPKTLKRVGRKGEQKPSPSALAYQRG